MPSFPGHLANSLADVEAQVKLSRVKPLVGESYITLACIPNHVTIWHKPCTIPTVTVRPSHPLFSIANQHAPAVNEVWPGRSKHVHMRACLQIENRQTDPDQPPECRVRTIVWIGHVPQLRVVPRARSNGSLRSTSTAFRRSSIASTVSIASTRRGSIPSMPALTRGHSLTSSASDRTS